MTDPMVTVLYFAQLRERIGLSQEQVALPPGSLTVSGLIDLLAARDPAHAQALERRDTLRCAVDQVLAAPDALVGPGSEVALFPPVTGG